VRKKVIIADWHINYFALADFFLSPFICFLFVIRAQHFIYPSPPVITNINRVADQQTSLYQITENCGRLRVSRFWI